MKFQQLQHRLRCFLLLPVLVVIVVSGCGGDTTGESDEQSKLFVSLTDAEGDFTEYTVDVVALKLFRSNGAVIETLPNTTTLDFAQYIDVTEFLTTATVPVGRYDKAEIALDYSNAQLSVENADGSSIRANAVDDSGDPLQNVTLTTMINSGTGFVIHPGQPASLNIDFDLEASNEVEIDPSGNSATVTVNPVLVANTSIDDEKTRRLRGLLDNVDLTAGSFDVNIRPFRIRHRSFGNITVYTNGDTHYEIDGVSYGADAGLNELDQLPAFSPLVTLGRFDFQQRRFLAEEVYAGSSVPWHDRDILKGSVIARAGNRITVLGATIERDDGHFQFNDEVSVDIDSTTKVTKQGSSDPVNIDDISVGQKVVVLGEMLDDNTMDATDEGLVRMRYSDVAGSVDQVSPLSLDLQHINRRNVSRYDFSGTGIDSGHDAVANEYEIDSGLLSLNTLSVAEPIWVRGFPTQFATAPEDFTAKTVIDASQVVAKMLLSYGQTGSAMAIVSLDATGLLLDLNSASGRHFLKQAGIVTGLHDFASVPLILPNDGHALYAISQGRKVDTYTRWENFEQALNRHISDGRQVIFVHSKGEFSLSELTLKSRQVVVRLNQ